MTDWPGFYETISEIKFTMLVTHDAAGKMQARPFTTQVAGREGAVWFFTRTDSDVVADIGQDQDVLLCYADPSKNCFVSAAGTASLSHDRALIAELWQPAYTTFFPAGIDDPALCLLRVQIDRADIWDSEKSTMDRMLTIARAAVGMEVEKEELSAHVVLKK